MKKHRLLLLGFAFLGASLARAQTAAPTLTGLKRVYADNSTWTVGTTAGSISLKNLRADGGEWLASGGGKTYHLKRTYSDDSEWRVTETGTSLLQAYKGDNAEWRVQRGRQAVAFRDQFKDGAQWSGDGFALTRKFSDGSDWAVKDQTRTQPLDVKLLLVFAALHSHLARH